MALPAAGNRITGGWQWHYRRLAIQLPSPLAICQSQPTIRPDGADALSARSGRTLYICILLSGKSSAGRRMAEGHPKPDVGGFACSPGQATEGSDTLGRVAEPASRCKCKSTKRGQRPRWAMVQRAHIRLARAFLSGRGSLGRSTQGVTPFGRLPWATRSPSCGGRGMAFSHPHRR